MTGLVLVDRYNKLLTIAWYVFWSHTSSSFSHWVSLTSGLTGDLTGLHAVTHLEFLEQLLCVQGLTNPYIPTASILDYGNTQKLVQQTQIFHLESFTQVVLHFIHSLLALSSKNHVIYINCYDEHVSFWIRGNIQTGISWVACEVHSSSIEVSAWDHIRTYASFKKTYKVLFAWYIVPLLLLHIDFFWKLTTCRKAVVTSIWWSCNLCWAQWLTGFIQSKQQGWRFFIV